MESRKIQKVGAATLTLSLPKEWAARRNLKKGDPVFLLEEGDALRVLPGPVAEERQRAQKEFIVDADLCDVPGMLERVIVGNYVLGRERIVVRATQRLGSGHQDEVRRAVRRLMGMGIIEETLSKVSLHCSIDPANYPIESLLKRLYNLGATMLSESFEALAKGDSALAEDAMKREDDADTMYWLILRLILQAQLDEGLVEKLGRREQDLVRAVMRGIRDPQGILPSGRIYSGLAQVGGYARSIALIAYNRYLERPTNLCRPSAAPV